MSANLARVNNSGHRADSVWIVGRFKDTPEMRVFLTRVENLNIMTLTENL